MQSFWHLILELKRTPISRSALQRGHHSGTIVRMRRPWRRTRNSVADSPIGSPDDDQLGRQKFAEEFAREILSAPADEGYVLALTGAWGSGKTSVLNMTIASIGEQASVVQFNPWMFSGTEALIPSFFLEVAKVLGKKKAVGEAVVKQLATYGHILASYAAPLWASGAVEAAATVLDRLTKEPPVLEERDSLTKALAKLEKRIVVVLDDIDRLRPEEVRDIVRLVRLVGDFPNTLYVLAFDRQRVEECLGDGDLLRGRAYLEKIVQVAYEVPLAHPQDLQALLRAGLDLVVAQTKAPLHAEEWQKVFYTVILPLVRSPRDVRRYLQALPMVLRMIGDEVALEDVLGLEAVRVLLPEMLKAMAELSEYLTNEYDTGALVPDHKSAVIATVKNLDATLGGAVLSLLFPLAHSSLGESASGEQDRPRLRKQRKEPAVLCAPVN